MHDSEAYEKVSIDPPNHARLMGVDARDRRHRYDPYDDRMFVEIESAEWSWVVGPCPDLERWIEDMKDAVGWKTVRYSGGEPFKVMADALEIVDDGDDL